MEHKQPITNETMFELASVSKQFTALAIMQLKEKKKLDYSDDIKKFFPLFPVEHVTIKNLLQHTSGIPDFLSWGKERIDTEKINFNADIISSLIKNLKNLDFQPGDSMAYSNTNYVLLASIVEKISGSAFKNYMYKNIFIPAGMKNTF